MKLTTQLSRVRSKQNYSLNKLEELGHDISPFNDNLFNETPDIQTFWNDFKSYRQLLKKEKLTYDFSYIIFPSDNKNILLKDFNYHRNIDFSYCIFKEPMDYSSFIFHKEVSFNNTTFNNEVRFSGAHFQKSANFSEIYFKADTYFSSCLFQDTVNFENSACEGIFDFSDVAFTSLILDKASFPHASYLRLDGWNNNIDEDMAREQLSAKHFKTKETARIIKAHFEKQNNIIESNIYYPIEMDKYREELADYSNPFMAFFTNPNYLVTTLSKYISNYGTSWIRAGLVILLFSFSISYIYSLFYIEELHTAVSDLNNIGAFNPKISIYYQGLAFFWFGSYFLSLFFDSEIRHRIKKSIWINNVLKTIIFMLVIASILICFFFYNEFDYDTILQAHNYVSKVVNPFGAFKSNDIFKHNEAFGTIVRLITLTLMYQFLVAFRQNTRRK